MAKDWSVLLKPPVRRTLDAMLAGATTLTEIASATRMSKSALLPHLKTLSQLGVVDRERVPTPTGSEAIYRLRDASLHISIDAQRHTAIAWGSSGPWSPEFPLLAQIPQIDVRLEIAAFLRALGSSPTVIVFGSAARGDATWKSDVDLIIVVERVTPDLERRVESAAFEAAAVSQHAFQPLLMDSAEWTSSQKRIVAEARKEGIIVSGGEHAPWSTMQRYAAISI